MDVVADEKSKVQQLLCSWFTASTRPKRQAGWPSSACEMQYATLAAATNNFSPANVLGEGGTSRVFRAKLDDDAFAAVKRLESACDRLRAGSQFQVSGDIIFPRVCSDRPCLALGFARMS